MPKSTFLSYVYEDHRWRDKVQSWVLEGLLGPDIVATSESEDLRPQGEAAIEQHLKPKIRGAAAVVCLVGQNTHNDRSWVQYELDVATSCHTKIVLLRVPGTTGAAPPRYGHLPIQTFDPSTLRGLL